VDYGLAARDRGMMETMYSQHGRVETLVSSGAVT
jgi:hypothetical protein